MILGIGVVIAFSEGGWNYLAWRFGERMSIADRLQQFAARVDPLWEMRCHEAGLSYPPMRARLLGLKKEKRLEIYAAEATGPWKALASYPVLAASGGPGPKLREGDNQVPEGLYRIALLNPNSLFHVSLRVDYPNAEDREQARADGRDRLGGDIMIHDGRASVGCIAIGDPAIEEVFTLAARCGLDRIEVVIAPADFRAGAQNPSEQPAWMDERYVRLRAVLAELPRLVATAPTNH
ncbi:MAG TPA: L,D-transpeptidase family protein [Planctomycetota bacterium]|nr:L,D-transpeptidase family protein [Planctomycetota bacterium]